MQPLFYPATPHKVFHPQKLWPVRCWWCPRWAACSIPLRQSQRDFSPQKICISLCFTNRSSRCVYYTSFIFSSMNLLRFMSRLAVALLDWRHFFVNLVACFACSHTWLWDRNMKPQVLPCLWFCVRLMMMSRMDSMLFPLHTPPYSVSLQEI